MKFVMMGSGGVGGYYGARLQQAGHDVVFVARGAHAQAMREKGLTIRSAELGDARLAKAHVVEDPRQAGAPDVVVVAVKLWDSESAAQQIRPIVGAQTTAVSLQNGVDKDEILARAIGREHVIGGVTHIAAVIAEPGVIAHTGKLQKVTLGELEGKSTGRVDRIVQALKDAHVDALASDEIAKVTWEKFVFLTALSGVTALTRKPVGAVREHPATRALLLDALAETAAVARAEGVALDEGLPQKLLQMMDGLNPAMTSSMAQDLSRGRPLELEWLSGAVVKRARKHGLATPAHRAIYAGLVLHGKG
jgi:2-dehydropantoate 2-reductase